MFRRLVPLLLMGSCAVEAHDPITTKITWSQEISRLFYKRCASCHSQGGAAPMALTSYEEARPWAKAIKEEVLERRMPPWGAVKGFGHFRNDAGLSQEEINLVAEWVEGGAPEGNPQYLPTKRNPPAAEVSQRSGVPVQSALRLTRAVVLDGIRAKLDADSVQVTAHRPDGSIAPLLWLKNYKGEWNRTFLFRRPMRLPKGTRIAVTPASFIELITVKR